MNPHTMMREKIKYTFFPTEQLGPFWAETLARNIQAEPHLLPQHPATLRNAAENRRLLVAYSKEDDVLIGCAALWPLGESDEGIWLEFGTVFLIKPYRYRQSGVAVADEIYRRALKAFSSTNILATTANRAAVRAGERAGLIRVRYADLPLNILRATCVCPASKTGCANPLFCPLADATCFVRVTPETYERLGRPQSPPFPF